MHLGAWPGGSWLPWRAAPLLLCSCSCLVSERLPQEWSYLSFHLFTCTMGFAPIKWTCTAFFRPRQLTDRAILAIRQTQEKNAPQTSKVPSGKDLIKKNLARQTSTKFLKLLESSGKPESSATKFLADLFCSDKTYLMWS